MPADPGNHVIVPALVKMLEQMDDGTPLLREWRENISIAIRVLRETEAIARVNVDHLVQQIAAHDSHAIPYLIPANAPRCGVRGCTERGEYQVYLGSTRRSRCATHLDGVPLKEPISTEVRCWRDRYGPRW